MAVIENDPGITLDEIVKKLHSNYQTTSEHTRRLHQAGLITKQYFGHTVQHTLSAYGSQLIIIMRNFKK